MPNSFMPTFEPMPYYMTAMGMQGARFLEGNDGSGNADDGAGDADDGAGNADDGAAGDGAAGDGEGKTPANKPEGKEGAADEFKSPESKSATLADLAKERADRKQAQSENDTLTTSVAERDTTISAHVATIATRESEISVLKLALAEGITEESDLDLLREITDDAKRRNLAKRLANKGDGVVYKSGTGNGSSTGGGSIAERRREIAARKNN